MVAQPGWNSTYPWFIPIKPWIKRIFWHPEWWVPDRAPQGSASTLGTGWKYSSWVLTHLNFPVLQCQHQYLFRISVLLLVLLTKFDLWAAHLAEGSSWLCILQGIITSEMLSSCQIPKHSLVRGQSGSGAFISAFCSREGAGSCLWCCACRLRAAGAALPHQTGPSTGAADEESKQN